MEVRFHLDAESGQPHILRHGLSQAEVEEVLRGPGEDLPARRNSRMKLGRTTAGRYLAVIYHYYANNFGRGNSRGLGFRPL